MPSLRLSLAAILAGTAAAVRTPPPGGLPNYTAVRLWPNATAVENALCLDGSPPLYYISPGWGDGADKWQLHHEGGAWCGSAEECYGWWGYRSTLVDPDVMAPTAMDNMGYFNRSSESNSMYNWNFVFIRYCDGWSFATDLDQPQFITNSSGANITINFRGLAVLNAVREDLLANRGLAAATDLVVGGCSAGGLAVFLHCDEWAARVAKANPATNTVCLADSGWFPLVPATGFPSTWFNGVWQRGISLNISSALNPACLADNAASPWLCGMAEVAALYISTPLFLYQSQYDSFQIFNMERCIPMPPDPTSPCQNETVTIWGGNLTAKVNGWLASAKGSSSAAFVDSCYHHCGGWADFDQIKSWSGPGSSGGLTGSQAFALWRGDPKAHSGIWQQQHDYPCLGATCCGPHGPDGLSATGEGSCGG